MRLAASKEPSPTYQRCDRKQASDTKIGNDCAAISANSFMGQMRDLIARPHFFTGLLLRCAAMHTSMQGGARNILSYLQNFVSISVFI
jgi:oligoribonuclease (3'-5' exoribonuclease)